MMRIPARWHSMPGREGGMILITVIFIMVVLGLLAGFLVQSLNSQHSVATLAQLSRQAGYAAASGVEWGRTRALQNGVCSTAQIAISDFSVTVSCNSLTVTEGASVYQVFDLEANAQRGSYGSADFVRRSERARVSNR
jgi:MSHA biogenesis protein MshP